MSKKWLEEDLLGIFWYNVWFIERLFWQYSKRLIVKQDYLNLKNYLKEKWYKNIDNIFPDQQDNQKIIDLTKIAFKFWSKEENGGNQE